MISIKSMRTFSGNGHKWKALKKVLQYLGNVKPPYFALALLFKTWKSKWIFLMSIPRLWGRFVPSFIKKACTQKICSITIWNSNNTQMHNLPLVRKTVIRYRKKIARPTATDIYGVNIPTLYNKSWNWLKLVSCTGLPHEAENIEFRLRDARLNRFSQVFADCGLNFYITTLL